jgi:hypothetical protein
VITTPTVRVGDVLPRVCGVTEMCAIFGLTPSGFHRRERKGYYERFELKPKIGPKRWSGTLLKRYLDCEAGASRFVTAGRKAS